MNTDQPVACMAHDPVYDPLCRQCQRRSAEAGRPTRDANKPVAGVDVAALLDEFDQWETSTEYMRTTTRPMDAGEQMAQRDAHALLRKTFAALDTLTREQAEQQAEIARLRMERNGTLIALEEAQAEIAKLTAEREVYPNGNKGLEQFARIIVKAEVRDRVGILRGLQRAAVVGMRGQVADLQAEVSRLREQLQQAEQKVDNWQAEYERVAMELNAMKAKALPR